jgi:predicted kinase
MPTLTILIGVPGSGKTTYLSDKKNVFVASSDNYIEHFARHYYMTYDEVFATYSKRASRLFHQDVERGFDSGFDFVIDRTNLTKKVRKNFINKAKQYGYDVEAVFFYTPDEEEHECRLNSRPGKIIPKHVIDSMKENLEEPRYDEGFDRIIIDGKLLEEELIYLINS